MTPFRPIQAFRVFREFRDIAATIQVVAAVALAALVPMSLSHPAAQASVVQHAVTVAPVAIPTATVHTHITTHIQTLIKSAYVSTYHSTSMRSNGNASLKARANASVNASASSRAKAAHVLKAVTVSSPLPVPAGVATVQIAGLRPASSSCFVTVAPLTGAHEYIAFDPARPNDIKCFGVDLSKRNADGSYTTPMLTVQWQGVPFSKSETLVVEALDQTYPAAASNILAADFTPAYPSALIPQSAASMNMSVMYGSNCGASLIAPHVLATNAQGMPTAKPNVIGISAPFTVTCTNTMAIPSSKLATQVFTTNFNNGSFSPITVTDAGAASGTQAFTAGNKTQWNITYSQVAFGNPGNALTTATLGTSLNGTLSQTFVHRRHLMDVTFDGGPPIVSNPVPHVAHGYWGISPAATFDISSGKVMHITFDVDGYFPSGRKSIEVLVWQAGSPPTAFYLFNGALSSSNNMLVLTIDDGKFASWVVNGPPAPAGPNLIPVTGALGQAAVWAPRYAEGTPDLDMHWDYYFSSTHETLYCNGQVMLDTDFIDPSTGNHISLPFTQCGFNLGHLVYHTGLFVEEEAQYDPGNTFERSIEPYSDERHWDGIGAEVLPAGYKPVATQP